MRGWTDPVGIRQGWGQAVNLRDFTYLKPVKRSGKTLLYGASQPDGPWFRLTKREATFIAAHADRVLSNNVTDRNATAAIADPSPDV